MFKAQAIEAARQVASTYFPDCHAALLAGSVIRGEATETSDLDIVIFDQRLSSAYRESFIAFGWPIEAFVHNFESYKDFFETDRKRAQPSLPRMVAEGIILKNSDALKSIRLEAQDLLAKGPEEWSEETIKIKRYFITDALDDFIGASIRAEELFIANTLAELLSEFYLRTHKQWVGSSKWTVRALKRFDPEFSNLFINAFEQFYRAGDKAFVIKLVDDVLYPFGGRCFHGFSLGK